MNRNSKRSLRALLCTAVAATLVGIGAGPAAAAEAGTAADPTCAFTRTLCLWDGTSYTGNRFTVQALNPTVGTCVNLTDHGWGNGRAKSAKNTANQPARLYTTGNCTGTPYQIMPGGSYGSISFNSNSVYVY